jgi:hypothetical protein
MNSAPDPSTGHGGTPRLDLLRLPHRLPNRRRPKGPRPLRGRASREPWPRGHFGMSAGVSVLVSAPAHLTHVSSLSGRAAARIRPVIPGPIRRRRQRRESRFPVAGSAVGVGFLGHPAPAEKLSLPHGRPTGDPAAGPQRGCRVAHDQAAIGQGACFTRGTVVRSRPAVGLRPAPAALQGPPADHRSLGRPASLSADRPPAGAGRSPARDTARAGARQVSCRGGSGPAESAR